MSKPPDEKEIILLQEFRVAIKDVVTGWKFKNDSYLLRWLRARNHNLERAEAMLRNSIKWRKEKNIDTILLEPIPADFNNFFNLTAFGAIDKLGRPVIGVPFGEWDLRELLDNNRGDELVRFLNQSLEILDSTMQEMWKNGYPFISKWPHTQFTVLIDLNGFTYSKMMHKKSLDYLLEIMKMYEAHYPETLGKAIVLNAPRIFSMLFAMIKPILSEHTLSKISIFGFKESDWKKAILEVVEEDQLPPRFGGTKMDASPI